MKMTAFRDIALHTITHHLQKLQTSNRLGVFKTVLGGIFWSKRN
jgi:hypothetical protein